MLMIYPHDDLANYEVSSSVANGIILHLDPHWMALIFWDHDMLEGLDLVMLHVSVHGNLDLLGLFSLVDWLVIITVH